MADPAAAVTGAGPKMDSPAGWLVVFAGFVGIIFSVGVLIVYSFGLLAPAIAAEYGWNPLETGTALSIFSLANIVMAPVYGMLIDRYGGRAVVIVSTALFGLCVAAFALIPNNLMVFYLAFIAVSVAGGGTLPGGYASVIVGWFDRHRGMALALTMVGVGVGAAITPPLFNALNQAAGWRTACLVLGGAILFIGAPVLLLAFRPNPALAAVVRHREPAARVLRRLGDYARGRAGSVLFFFALGTGVLVIAGMSSLVPILRSRGVEANAAAGFQALAGMSMIVGRIVIGPLLDRFFAPRVVTGVLLISAAAMVGLYLVSAPPAYVFAAFGLGIAAGAEMDVLGFLISRYFPKQDFGSIFGSLFAVFSLGGAIGAALVGWIATQSGGYHGAVVLLAASALAVALASFAMPGYARREDANASPAIGAPAV